MDFVGGASFFSLWMSVIVGLILGVVGTFLYQRRNGNGENTHRLTADDTTDETMTKISTKTRRGHVAPSGMARTATKTRKRAIKVKNVRAAKSKRSKR